MEQSGNFKIAFRKSAVYQMKGMSAYQILNASLKNFAGRTDKENMKAGRDAKQRAQLFIRAFINSFKRFASMRNGRDAVAKGLRHMVFHGGVKLRGTGGEVYHWFICTNKIFFILIIRKSRENIFRRGSFASCFSLNRCHWRSRDLRDSLDSGDSAATCNFCVMRVTH
ncbi:MAG: hypothetical protein CRN43_15830 [Candidatus Nephrothrix sp. EaCA]|nr:MAG: hypothetical protein CRN43_15830 [Candidatus Nephrothrix sp. EaCA]